MDCYPLPCLSLIHIWLKQFRDFAWSDLDSLTMHQSARIERTEKGFRICIYNRTDYDALLARLEKQRLSLPTADEWAYLCGGGCRTLFPWGDGMDYSMRLHWFEDTEEDEDRPYDMEAVSYTHLMKWRGQNLLGFALMEVRDELRRVTQNEMLCDWSMVWQQ